MYPIHMEQHCSSRHCQVAPSTVKSFQEILGISSQTLTVSSIVPKHKWQNYNVRTNGGMFGKRDITVLLKAYFQLSLTLKLMK